MRVLGAAIRAELLKSRHSALPWLGLGMPVLDLILALLLSLLMPAGPGTEVTVSEIWNWWGSILQPALLALLAVTVMGEDTRQRLRSLLLLPRDPGLAFLAKTAVVLLWSAVSNLAVFLLASVLPGMLGLEGTPLQAGFAAFMLNLATSAWLIPLGLLGTAAVGPIFGMALPFFLEYAGSMAWDSPIWWLVPSASSLTTTAPVLGVLPNGLPMRAESPLEVFGVESALSLVISVSLFLALTVLGSRWFSKRETV